MASSYLKQVEEKLRWEAEQKKYQVATETQNRIVHLNGKEKMKGEVKESAPMGCGLAILAVSIIGGGTALGGGPMLALGLVLAAVFILCLHGKKTSEVEKFNQDIQAQIQKLREDETHRYSQIDQEFQAELAKEKQRFKSAVAEARKKYGGRTTYKPIVTWLADQFDAEIRKGDRRPHQKMITILFAFRVTEQGIERLEWVSHQGHGGYGKSQGYEFGIHRFQNLVGLEEQVGFAQAVAKLVQFEIMMRFPQDPVLPTHAKPKVMITSDDSLMELHYEVMNPNYRVAVRL